MHYFPTEERKKKLAIVLPIAGLAVLGLSGFYGTITDWGTWTVLAVAFVVLELRAVEVNDRMWMSASVMAILTAGVVAAVEAPTGRLGATFAMSLMAAFGAFTSGDILERRWFQPAVNFGQMILTAAAAGLVLDGLFHFLPTELTTTQLLPVALGSSAAAIVYTSVNFIQVRGIVRYAYGPQNVLPWSGLGQLLGSHAVMGAVGGLMGATLLIVDGPVLPILIVLYLIGHLAFVSHSQLREAQLSTLRGFVKTLEAKDLYTRGHTERVAMFARLIGEQMGFKGATLESIRWAALIHDVGKLAVPGELIRKRGKLNTNEYEEMQRHVHVVEEILSEVEFLQPMVEIASAHHTHYDGGGYGHAPGNRPDVQTGIISVADAFDAMTSNRAYRMALSQEYAIEELRKHSGTQFAPDVVEALAGALQGAGLRYGTPHMDDDEYARRLAEAEAEGITIG